MNLQKEDELIRQYFKTTTEPYEDLEWNGKTLQVWNKDKIIEKYTRADLCEIIEGFDNI